MTGNWVVRTGSHEWLSTGDPTSDHKLARRFKRTDAVEAARDAHGVVEAYDQGADVDRSPGRPTSAPQGPRLPHALRAWPPPRPPDHHQPIDEPLVDACVRAMSLSATTTRQFLEYLISHGWCPPAPTAGSGNGGHAELDITAASSGQLEALAGSDEVRKDQGARRLIG